MDRSSALPPCGLLRASPCCPIQGKLWPLSESYRSNPTDFEVTLGLALLNVLYVGMGLAAAWSCRTNPGVLLIVAFILIRTAFLTQLQTCEAALRPGLLPRSAGHGAQLFRRLQTRGTSRETVIA